MRWAVRRPKPPRAARRTPATINNRPLAQRSHLRGIPFLAMADIGLRQQYLFRPLQVIVGLPALIHPYLPEAALLYNVSGDAKISRLQEPFTGFCGPRGERPAALETL